MKVFFDTEFTGLYKDATLISIGLVSEDNKSFYAEFTDYDEAQLNDWLKENVIAHLYKTKGVPDGEDMSDYHVGSKKEIADALAEWFAQFDSVELVSDVCHYDMVMLTDIFGTAFDLPKNVSPSCYDINQDIAAHYNITQTEAFDKSREEILSKLDKISKIVADKSGDLVVATLGYSSITGDKHNALYDAKVIKGIYKEIEYLKELEKKELEDFRKEKAQTLENIQIPPSIDISKKAEESIEEQDCDKIVSYRNYPHTVVLGKKNHHETIDKEILQELEQKYNKKEDIIIIDLSKLTELKVIKENTFANYESVENIILPEGLEEIEDNAFKNCKSLETIALPSSIKKLNIEAFNGCENLTKINYRGETLHVKYKKGKLEIDKEYYAQLAMSKIESCSKEKENIEKTEPYTVPASFYENLSGIVIPEAEKDNKEKDDGDREL